jgi:hypothetical protein
MLLPASMDWMASRRVTAPVLTVSLSVFTVMVAGPFDPRGLPGVAGSVGGEGWSGGRDGSCE